MDDEHSEARPDPVVAGIAHDQVRASEEQSKALVQSLPDAKFAEQPLTEAVAGIGEFGVRGVGAMALLIASIKRLERDLEQTRAECHSAARRVDESVADFHRADREAAVLRAQLTHARQEQRMRQVLITSGGLIAGIAAPGFATGHAAAATGGAILAAVLLFAGWFRKTSDGEADQ